MCLFPFPFARAFKLLTHASRASVAYCVWCVDCRYLSARKSASLVLTRQYALSPPLTAGITKFDTFFVCSAPPAHPFRSRSTQSAFKGIQLSRVQFITFAFFCAAQKRRSARDRPRCLNCVINLCLYRKLMNTLLADRHMLRSPFSPSDFTARAMALCIQFTLNFYCHEHFLSAS